MKKHIKLSIIQIISLSVLFICYTYGARYINEAPIGPNGSVVGYSSVNEAVFNKLGTSELWYGISEVLGFIPLITAGCFALLGLYQLIKRKSIAAVDVSLYLLAALYALVAAAYVLFEIFPVNYRPVLTDGVLEASFPSSHTLLACTVMATAILQFHIRISSKLWLIILDTASVLVIIFTAAGRLLAGVHWLSDIVGAFILSAIFIVSYCTVLTVLYNRAEKRGFSAK